MKLLDCNYCHAVVHVNDIETVIDKPELAGHVALLYKCARCNMPGRTAVSASSWKNLQILNGQAEVAYEDDIKAALIELDAVDTAGDLIALWASYPGAPIMEVAQPCRCEDCGKRYGKPTYK